MLFNYGARLLGPMTFRYGIQLSCATQMNMMDFDHLTDGGGSGRSKFLHHPSQTPFGRRSPSL